MKKEARLERLLSKVLMNRRHQCGSGGSLDDIEFARGDLQLLRVIVIEVNDAVLEREDVPSGQDRLRGAERDVNVPGQGQMRWPKGSFMSDQERAQPCLRWLRM